MKTQGQSRFQHAEHVSWRRVDGQAIVLDLNTSVYFSLNETGALIWERLGEGDDLEAVAGAVCRQFAAKPEQVRRHVEALVSDLLKEGLLRAR